MANIKSQIKRNKQTVVRHERNKAVKSELRTRTKNAVTAVGTEDEATALRLAIKRIDMAASKGIIHKNTGRQQEERPDEAHQRASRRGLTSAFAHQS